MSSIRRTRRTSRFLSNVTQNRVSRIRLKSNAHTIDRIARITTRQISNNPLENNFYNGTNFDENKSFEYLILPIGHH
ncbi:unnamed protein product [Rhizophagus irregularis]|jgi:hypothetical protein|uniref:uncharacterized protein n=1 Tax=Rhizophagus irregularis TaxID=588596 RepID=UPI001C1517F5|nr:hypothetical protein OCT59_003028 [Rhizophagus irregularis]CAB4428437.1 unnamed protein product [Rhizophagus irregularis]CAB4428587.1 unnamed protein product [Rhizophagus irregularis]